MKIKKTYFNLIVDILMLILMMLISSIGFLIKYILVPGFMRQDIYGKNVELYFQGLDRHQWGAIHLKLSFILFFLLFLHIVLHWRQIVGIFKNMIKVRSHRILITTILVIISLGLIISPFTIKPEVFASTEEHQNHKNNKNINQQKNIQANKQNTNKPLQNHNN